MGLRTAVKRLLDRLGRAADEQYGSKPPSCCAGKKPAAGKVRADLMAKKRTIR